MTWDEFWGDFSPSDYAASIANLSESGLQAEHAHVRQKSLSANAGIGAGAAGTFHTGGLSLIASGISYRKRQYNNQKQAIIEERMAREGWSPTDMRKRDLLRAVGPSAVAAVVVPGADHVANHFLTSAAGHGATTYTASHGAATASAALHHPIAFTHAAEQGAKAQVEAVEQSLLGHHGVTALVNTEAMADGSAGFLGNTAGQAAAAVVELKGVEKGVGWVVEKGVERLMEAGDAGEGVECGSSSGGDSGGSLGEGLWWEEEDKAWWDEDLSLPSSLSSYDEDGNERQRFEAWWDLQTRLLSEG